VDKEEMRVWTVFLILKISF